MFCCMDFGTSGSDFPGNRNRTKGQAEGTYNQTYYTQKKGETVSVTVPLNKYGGDEILVSSPKGKCVRAVIPHAMKPGDKFQVDIPLGEYNVNNNNALGSWNQSASPRYAPQEAVTPIEYPPPSAPPMDGNYNRGDHSAEIHHEKRNIFDSLRHSSDANKSGMAESTKNLILIKVPPGVAPGAMIQVKVPGEDRLISAIVPPNTSEFHVSYDPYPQKHSQTPQVHVLGQQNSYSNNGINTTGYDSYNAGGSGNYNNKAYGYQKAGQNQPKKANEDDSMALPATMGILAGSALLGVAGVMIGSHNNN